MLKFKAVAHMLKMTTGKSVKAPDTPETIRRLLQPIESFEVETSSNTDSDVEDVFEDIHKKGYPDPKKSLNTNAKKIEANKVIAELFTENHKRTMSVMRSSVLKDGILSDNIQDIMNVLESPKVNHETPEEVLKKIADILDDPDLMIESSPRQMEPGRKMSTMSYDYMSGIWNMLEAECEGKSFNVTPQNYDINKQEGPHWLEKPDFSQKTLDKSRIKCEKWLSEQ